MPGLEPLKAGHDLRVIHIGSWYQSYFGPRDRDGIVDTGFRLPLVDLPRPPLAWRASKQPRHFFLERNGAVLRRTGLRYLQD
jgi:hypothetical protein